MTRMNPVVNAYLLVMVLGLSVVAVAPGSVVGVAAAQADSDQIEDEVEKALWEAHALADPVYSRIVEQYGALITAYEETYGTAIDTYYRAYASAVHGHNRASLLVHSVYNATYQEALVAYHQTYNESLNNYEVTYAAALDAYHDTYPQAADSYEAAYTAALVAYDTLYRDAADSYEETYRVAQQIYQESYSVADGSYQAAYERIHQEYRGTYGDVVEQYGAVGQQTADAYGQAKPTLDLAYDRAAVAYEEVADASSAIIGASFLQVNLAYGQLEHQFNSLGNKVQVGDIPPFPGPPLPLPSDDPFGDMPQLRGVPLPSSLPLPPLIHPPGQPPVGPLPSGVELPVAPPGEGVPLPGESPVAPPGEGVPLPGESPVAPPGEGVPLPGESPVAPPSGGVPLPSDPGLGPGSAPPPPGAPQPPEQGPPEELPFGPPEEAPFKEQAASLFEPVQPTETATGGGGPMPPNGGSPAAFQWNEIDRDHAVLAAIAGVGLLSLLVSGLITLARSGVLSSLFPLIARKEGPEVLEHELRMMIMDIIDNHPGITLADLVKKVGITRSTVRYHLRVLGRERHIQLLPEGRNTHLFRIRAAAEAGPDRLAALACLAHEQCKKVASLIMGSPGMCQRDVVDATGFPAGSIHNYIERLSESGLVRGQRDGRYQRYQPTSTLLGIGKQQL